MLGRGVAVAIVAMMLCGCAGRTGADFVTVSQQLGPPKAGRSRIVLLAEKRTGPAAAVCDVEVDGSPVGKLKPETYVYTDRPAGRHHLVATQALFPGDTTRDISTESGRTYFFLVKSSDRANTVTGLTMFGGLVGAVVASAATSGSQNLGPVDLVPLDEATARSTIAEFQLAE